MKNKKIFRKIALFINLIVISSLFLNNAYAGNINFNIFPNREVSGSNIEISGNTIPQTALTIQLISPDNSINNFYTISNNNGNFSYVINNYYTKNVGIYRVRCFTGNIPPSNLQEKTFEIFSNTPSPSNSLFYTDKELVQANNVDNAIFTVQIRDENTNPIPNKEVNIISTEVSDSITPLNTNITDKNGEVQFKVSSNVPGIHTYIAYINNTPLNKRVELIFMEANTQNNQTNYLQSNIIGSARNMGGPAEKIILEVPSEVDIGEYFNITVRVVDEMNNPALGYMGTIFFSSSDPNATVPLRDTGYTFDGTGNVTHTFSNATRLMSQGNHSITVVDINNNNLSDTQYITVGSATSANTNVNTSVSSGSSNIQIFSPTNNQKFASNTINIIGKTDPAVLFEVYRNDIKVGSKQSDAEGNIYFDLYNVPSGQHDIQIRVLNAQNQIIGITDKINFEVITSLPEIKTLEILPSFEVDLGSELILNLSSQSNLTKVSAMIDGKTYDLIENNETPGNYSVQFSAPSSPGEYIIKIDLLNALGQENEIIYDKKLTVGGENLIISELKLDIIDNKDLLLYWDNNYDSTNIKKYRLYYGFSEHDLNNFEDIDYTSLENNEILIETVDKDTKYYFALAIIDNNDKEHSKSNIISGIIETQDREKGIYDIDYTEITNGIKLNWEFYEDNNIHKFRVKYGNMSGKYLHYKDTLGVINHLNLYNLNQYDEYYIMIDALDVNDKVLYSSAEVVYYYQEDYQCKPQTVRNVKLIVQGDRKYLVWDEVLGVDYYNVYISTDNRNFGKNVVKTLTNSYEIYNLDPNVEYYYFSVKSACNTGEESLNYSNIVKVKSGPTVFIFIALSLLFAIAYSSIKIKNKFKNYKI